MMLHVFFLLLIMIGTPLLIIGSGILTAFYFSTDGGDEPLLGLIFAIITVLLSISLLSFILTSPALSNIHDPLFA